MFSPRARNRPISDHFDGKRFFTPGQPPLPTFQDILRWQFTRQSAPWPKWVPVSKQQLPKLDASPDQALGITWINHASFLLRSRSVHLLVDPVFSQRVGPFGWLGPRRVHAPGLTLEELPRIDAVLLSHDHYDHCDLASLRRIARSGSQPPIAITPLGNADLLRRGGFREIVELDWWEQHRLNTSLTVTVTPAQHWSNRLSGAKCSRLWGGFYLEFSGRSVHFVGDTGYHPSLFKEVPTRLGPPEFALVPIGAYEPRWFMRGQHCNPEEAVQIHRDLGAGQSIAMHWGTFQLTDEAREAPVAALREALAAADLSDERFRIMEPGQTLVV